MAEHQARGEAGGGWAEAVPEAGAMVPGLEGARSLAEPRGASPRGTYADGEHRPRAVHGVAVRPCADVSQVLPTALEPQLLVHELGKRLHPVRTAANADKLGVKCEFVGIFH